MNLTKNYKFSMPENSDVVDIDVLSNNFEMIDTEIETVYDTIKSGENNLTELSKNHHYRDNLLIDGGFKIWYDLETVSYLDELTYSATIWKNSLSGTWTVSKYTSGGGITISGTSVSGGLTQELGDTYYFNKEKMMLSLNVIASVSVSASAKIVISDTVQGTGTTIVASQQTIAKGESTVTFNFDTSNIEGHKYIAITILNANSFSGSITIKNAKLEFGDTTTPFSEDNYDIAKHAVARYYEQTWDNVWESGVTNFNNALYGHVYSRDIICFTKEKRVTPTVVLYNPYNKNLGGYYSTGSALSIIGTGIKCFFLNYHSSTSNNYPQEIKYFHYTADARLY